MESKGHSIIYAGGVEITYPEVDALNRIATALERIADVIERESVSKSVNERNNTHGRQRNRESH